MEESTKRNGVISSNVMISILLESCAEGTGSCKIWYWDHACAIGYMGWSQRCQASKNYWNHARLSFQLPLGLIFMAQVSISIHFPTCFPFRTFRNNLTFSIIFSDFISLPMVHRIPIGGWPRCCPGMNRSFRTSKVCWSPRTLRSKTQAALALALARVGMVRKCAQKIEGSYG